MDKFRFHVSDDQGHHWSDTWFVGANSGSVYMASRKLGGTLKLSLHPRGRSNDGLDCQFGHPSYYAARQIEAGIPPIPLIRWARPPIRDRQILQVARVLFPTDYLAPKSEADADGKLKIAFPIAPPGQATEISLFCTKVEPRRFEDSAYAQGFTPISYTPLGENEFASILVRNVEFDGSIMDKLVDRPLSLRPLAGFPEVGQPSQSVRALLVGGSPENGEALSLIEAGPLIFTRTS